MIELQKNNSEVLPIIVPDRSRLKSINFFLYKTDQFLTLIDAGLNTEECWDALIATLKSNKCELRDLDQILLTHHHIDHIGLVNRIVTEHPIPVYTHVLSIPRLKRNPDFLEQRIEFFSKLYKQMGCNEAGQKQVDYLKQSIIKNKGNRLEADIFSFDRCNMEHFDIIEVPGHAPDQVAFFDKSKQWLLSGDLLINHISSNAFVEPDQSGKRMLTLVDQINSLTTCLSLPIDLVYPGHGTLIEQPKELIKKRLDGIEIKADRLLSLIQQGVTTGNELAKTYYKKIYHQQFSLVMSEIIGHLDYLEYQGKINKTLKDHIWHYSIQ